MANAQEPRAAAAASAATDVESHPMLPDATPEAAPAVVGRRAALVGASLAGVLLGAGALAEKMHTPVPSGSGVVRMSEVASLASEADLLHELNSNPFWNPQYPNATSSVLKDISPPETPDHVCHLATETCDLSSYSKGDVIYIYPDPASGAECLDKGNKEFFFRVKKGEASKLFFYLQGGGACWDLVSFGANVCTKKCEEKYHDLGMFDFTNPANVFKDFTFVEVLYCSGDMHAGNAKPMYGPQRGYIHTSETVKWLDAQLTKQGGKLTDAVYAGSSAGSLGIYIWSQALLTKFAPYMAANAKTTVVGDSFIGSLTCPDKQKNLFEQFNMCNDQFLTADQVERCGAGTLKIQDIWTEAMQANPDTQFVTLQSKDDYVQMIFANVFCVSSMKEDRFYSISVDYMEKWDKMSNYVSWIRDGVPNNQDQSQHTFFTAPWYYTSDFRALEPDGIADKHCNSPVNGELVADFVTAIINRDPKGVSSMCYGERADQHGVASIANCDKYIDNTADGGVLYCGCEECGEQPEQSTTTSAPGPEPEKPPCFPAEARAELWGGEPIFMADVAVGDHVAVALTDAAPVFEPVLAFLHEIRAPGSYGFVRVAHERGILGVSENHLVFVLDAAGQRRSLLAADVLPGQRLVTADSSGAGGSVVLAVKRAKGSAGMFAPLTASGTIVVDGVLASNYALASIGADVPHAAIHSSFFAVRAYHAALGALGLRFASTEEAAASGIHPWAELLLDTFRDAPAMLAKWRA